MNNKDKKHRNKVILLHEQYFDYIYQLREAEISHERETGELAYGT